MWKRSGEQRLIIVARRRSLWFGPPPKPEFASGEVFGRLGAITGKAIELGQTGLYQLQMPHELRHEVGLVPVNAARVSACWLRLMLRR